MDEKTNGLILRTRPLTETSLIVQWITPDLGRLSTVAKGARRPNSPFRGKLDLFYAADLTLVRSRRSDLHTLREVVLRQSHPPLREHFERLQCAAYASRLVECASEAETPVPELFDLLVGMLDHLDLHPPHPALALAFQARLLDASGLLPDPDQTPLDPGMRQILRQLVAAPWELLHRLHFSGPQAPTLGHYLDTRFTEAFSHRPPPRPAS